MSTKLHIYTNTEFEGHWPVGTAAIVVAGSKEEARELLLTILISQGSRKRVKVGDFVELPIERGLVLCNGDY